MNTLRNVLCTLLVGSLAVGALNAQIIVTDAPVRVTQQNRYKLPQFTQGVVENLNGTKSNARLNYNLLNKEMQFLAPRGDTLSLANEQLIRQVKIQEEVFVYFPTMGFASVVEEFPFGQLVKHEYWKVAGVYKEGAYGKSTGASSIKNYQAISTGNTSIQQLDIKGDVVYHKIAEYYVFDANRTPHPLTRKGVLGLFPKQKAALQAYMKAESIRFDELDDLRKLLAHCATL